MTEIIDKIENIILCGDIELAKTLMESVKDDVNALEELEMRYYHSLKHLYTDIITLLTSKKVFLLYKRDYAEIPKPIFDLYFTNSFIAQNCGFKTIDNDISKLTNLKSLEFSNNRIEVLPYVISELFDLTSINIYFEHQLKSVEIDFSKLKNLETLIISYTRITEIPKSILDMPNLKTVILRSNKIKTIPNEFLEPTKFELDLRGNSFENNKLRKYKNNNNPNLIL